MQLVSVDARVEDTGFGIAGQHDAARADVSAAVSGPEFGHGETSEVDLPLRQKHLRDARPLSRDQFRRYSLLQNFPGCSDHVADGQVRVESDCKGKPLLAGSEHVDEDAGTACVA